MSKDTKQATAQQQGGKGNLRRAPQKMTTGLSDQRRKLAAYNRTR